MKRYAEIRNTIQSYRAAGHSDAVITRHLIRNEELPRGMVQTLLRGVSRNALHAWVPQLLLKSVYRLRENNCFEPVEALIRASGELQKATTLESAYMTLDLLRGELRGYIYPGQFGQVLDVLISHGLNVVNFQDKPYLAMISAKEIAVSRGISVDEFWGSMLRLWIEPQTAESRLQAQAA